ncbi:MAG: mechanosensitive ion channel family protein [Micromonosporaceae bacterium]
MEYLQNALGSVVAVAPKILLFLVILVVGWIVAKLLLNLVAKLLNRVGFDRAVERGGLRRWTGNSEPSQLTAKLVYYGVLLIALQMAFGVFGPNPISNIINAIVAFLPLAFVALVIVVITAAIATAVKDVITSALGGVSYGRMLGTIAQVFILGLGVIAALNQVGIAMTVTMPVLIAILATVGGVIVVGAGGGLIGPMRSRWERWLARGEAEMGVVRSELDRQTATTTAPVAGTPQPTYTGQGSAAAVDPSHPRAATPGATGATQTAGMTQTPGATPGTPPATGQVYPGHTNP